MSDAVARLEAHRAELAERWRRPIPPLFVAAEPTRPASRRGGGE
ncbi:hypothetical protein [Halarchaeum sp. CBA1220]|nr:hypothetical protein [Halarchaeum sp. CBA1220]